MLVLWKNLTEVSSSLMVSPQSLKLGPAMLLLCVPNPDVSFYLPSLVRGRHFVAQAGPAGSAQGQESRTGMQSQAYLVSPFCPKCITSSVPTGTATEPSWIPALLWGPSKCA